MRRVPSVVPPSVIIQRTLSGSVVRGTVPRWKNEIQDAEVASAMDPFLVYPVSAGAARTTGACYVTRYTKLDGNGTRWCAKVRARSCAAA